MDKENVSLALGRIPTGLFLVTFYNKDINSSDGILMSFVQQLSFEPPMISIAVKKERDSLKLIEKAGSFVVNIAGTQNNHLISKFYKGGSQALGSQDIKTRPLPNSQDIVLEECVSYLHCDVLDTMEHAKADHSLLIGLVQDGSLLNYSESNDSATHLRKNGFSY